MSKKYPKPYKSARCPYNYRCPYRSSQPKTFVDSYPRLYGRKSRCFYVRVYECPYEDKYSSSERYDGSWPYPHFR